MYNVIWHCVLKFSMNYISFGILKSPKVKGQPNRFIVVEGIQSNDSASKPSSLKIELRLGHVRKVPKGFVYGGICVCVVNEGTCAYNNT